MNDTIPVSQPATPRHLWLAFSAAIVVIGVALLLYARRLARSGVLR